jgi:hypothetical protein
MPIDRRRDHELRDTVDEYRRLAAEARVNAEKASSESIRAQFLSLAKSWEQLADALSGRPTG